MCEIEPENSGRNEQPPGNQPGLEWWPFVVGVARAGKTQEPNAGSNLLRNVRYRGCGSQGKCWDESTRTSQSLAGMFEKQQGSGC